jgi:hypothetical protein
MGRRVLLTLIAAASIGIGGYVHYKIWQHEYRHAPVREMFVANFVVSAVVVVLLLMGTYARDIQRVAATIGVLLAAGSLIAFALSRGPGLPTLHGTFKEKGLETTADYFFHFGSAKTVLVAEAVALLSCGSLLLDTASRRLRRRSLH